MKRNSIRPTYDSRETGPRYHVTGRINGKTVLFQHPIDDPFISQSVTVTWAGLLRSLLRFRSLKVEVLVGGDKDIVNDVLELDGNQLVPDSTRRDTFNSHINEAIGRLA
jgi:hypothetical protein